LNTVERKIHFFRAELPRDRDSKKRPVFDHTPVLRALDKTEFIDAQGGRYLADGEGGYLFASMPKNRFDRVLFGKSRRTSLPSVERSGQFSDLPIPPDAGIAEMAHIVFFKNGIVGAEFNSRAPRATTFGWYLSHKCDCKGLRINPLMSLDAYAQLDSADGIKAFDDQGYTFGRGHHRRISSSLRSDDERHS
jgi:hypothetical protein